MVNCFKKKQSEFLDLLEIIENCSDDDFYLTRNNKRIFIKTSDNLKIILNESHHIYYENLDTEKGIILIWKSVGADIKRNYIKIAASNSGVARRLLTTLLWHYPESVFIKIKKNSPLIPIFKEKGFKFIGGRGSQILLERSKFFSEN